MENVPQIQQPVQSDRLIENQPADVQSAEAAQICKTLDEFQKQILEVESLIGKAESVQTLSDAQNTTAAEIAQIIAEAQAVVDVVNAQAILIDKAQDQSQADDFDNDNDNNNKQPIAILNFSQVAQNGDNNEAEAKVQEEEDKGSFLKDTEIECDFNNDIAEGQIQNQASNIEQLKQTNELDSKESSKKVFEEVLEKVVEEKLEIEESSEKSVEEIAEEKIDSNQIVIQEASNNDGKNEDAPIDTNQIVAQEVPTNEDNNVNLSAQDSL